MTPAERALLLAMARDMVAATKSPYSNRCRDLNKAITAVEAEAKPKPEAKSCETCGDCGNATCHLVGGYKYPACTDAFTPRQPRSKHEAPAEGKSSGDKCSVCGSDPCECRSCETCSSYLQMYDKCLYPRDGECFPTKQYWQPKPAVCPTCSGVCNPFPEGSGYCPDCDGTGKKETHHD